MQANEAITELLSPIQAEFQDRPIKKIHTLRDLIVSTQMRITRYSTWFLFLEGIMLILNFFFHLKKLQTPKQHHYYICISYRKREEIGRKSSNRQFRSLFTHSHFLCFRTQLLYGNQFQFCCEIYTVSV